IEWRETGSFGRSPTRLLEALPGAAHFVRRITYLLTLRHSVSVAPRITSAGQARFVIFVEVQAHEGKLMSIRIGDVDISVQILDNEYRVAVLERLIDLLLRRSRHTRCRLRPPRCRCRNQSRCRPDRWNKRAPSR